MTEHTHPLSGAATVDAFKHSGVEFVDLKVEPGEHHPEDFAYMHGPAAREKFMAALRRLQGT